MQRCVARFLANAPTDDLRQDTRYVTINVVLCIMAIVLWSRFAHWTTHKVTIDLARTQYVYLMQPSTDALPVVEGMVD